MEHKNKSFSRIKRHQSDKVLRFSIRKYSFGAASVAVAALMFLGTHVVSADGVDDKNQPVIGAPNPKEKESPLVEPGKTEKVEVAKETEEREKTSENKEAVEANSLNNGTSTSTITVTKDASADKVAEKQTLDKTKLQANITKVQELLAKVNKEKAPASTLAAIQADLETANSVLNNNSLELTQAEIDAIAKKLNEKIFVLSSMPKINAPKKVLKEGENTIANTGSHDPHNGQSMDRGSSLRSVPIDKDKKRGQLGIVVADSGFVTGYATPSSTIEIKKNGQTLVTSTLDDSGAFKLNAPGIKVGDTVTLVVNGETVATEVVSQGHTVSFNDSLAYIKQVDGYTAAESDVEITVGGQKYKTKSQSNGYFTVDVDPNLMVKDAEVKAVVTKDGKVVGRGTSIVRETKVTDVGVGWTRNPMIDYSERDVYSPDTKQYAFISKGTADQAYDNIRVYREIRIEKNGDKYYYWMVDSGPAANSKAGLIKKISLAIPRTVGDPYDFTYTQYKDGRQESHEEFPTASAWAYVTYSTSRAYVKDGEKRPGSSYLENTNAWMDYIEPSNGWQKNIYTKNSEHGTDPNTDAFPRVQDMTGINKDGHEYKLVRGVIEDRMKVVAGQRTIMTFKTKVLEGDKLDQSIMSDWDKKDISNPMLSEIKERLANDPYIAYGGYVIGGKIRYREGQNAIIGTLPLKPEEATNFNFQPVSKEQTTKVGVVPDAIKSIENADQLPSGTTYRWFKDPDVSKVTEPGKPVYGKVEVVIPQRGTFIVDAAVHVIEDKPQTPIADDYTPKYDDGNGKPGTKVEIPLKEENGKKIPDGTTYVSDQPGVIAVDDKGKVTVTIPADKNPGDKVTGKVTVTYPDRSKEDVPVNVTVTNRDKDDYTPKYDDGNGKPGTSVDLPLKEKNDKKIPDGTTYVSDQPGVIAVDDKGKVTVTIPADKNPGDKVTGKVTVTYPDGSKEEVPVTVTVTTPARKTPTVEVEQDPKTGDVTVTPKKPDGSTYPPGTKVEIPGKDGKTIPVTIDENGKGKVPNSELPDGKVPGTAKITEPGKPAVEVPVTTPGKVTPATPTDTNPVAPVTPDTPVKPDTNGGSGQDAPAPTPATPTPNAVTPNADQVDTKTTMDNGAKSNDSQNVLPNTGTESNATLASLGLLGLLSGFGLVARKKKED